MKTPWTDNIDLTDPLPEYPRPQMVRPLYMMLNGTWEYAINKSYKFPHEYDGVITVPFSPETILSGVNRKLKKDEFLWYKRSVILPNSFLGKRLLLHFEAVDREATVWVNNTQVIMHSGGYLPFEADITDCLSQDSIVSIIVRVTDDTDHSSGTRGKQKTKRGGIWYTPQSGIWQSVWMEAVPDTYVKRLRITPAFDEASVSVAADVYGEVDAVAHFNGKDYILPAMIPVPDFEAWSPENPKLYPFTVSCGEDSVKSYFAMRKFSVEKDSYGVPRLFLNNQPYFQNGVLDQGYWPDGLYTAPSDEALVYDISTAKAMGFNMLRKHMKIEPRRWYYHCDRLGMIVWQDMPCGGGKYNSAVVSGPLLTGINLKDNAYLLFGRMNAEARASFKIELAGMIKHLYNCPCIALWVPFNEGWGQYDADKAMTLIQSIDKTRIIDHASGWHDQKIGKIRTFHVYFKDFVFKADKKGRAVALSEFGGYSHKVDGHTYSNKYFGYKKYEMPAQLEIAIEDLYDDQIRPAVKKGLCAAVYTQLTDVEDELNGIMTYDRKINKIAPETMKEIISI